MITSLEKNTLLQKIKRKLRRREYKFIGQGRNRAAYLTKSGRYVIKVPASHLGEADNYSESRIYSFNKANSNGIPYAKCRLFKFMGFDLLIMEKVESINQSKWEKYVDGGQVGKNKNGKIVAYDYGRY